MAGDWIPATKGLSRKREVLAIASMTGRSRREVHSILLDFWGWCDDETQDGHIPRLTIDSLASAVGEDAHFWHAVASVGWLQVVPDGLVIPNFTNWMGESAKKRLRHALRQRQLRACQKRDAKSDARETVARARKRHHRTEQNSTERIRTPLPPTGGLCVQEFTDAWNAVASFTPCKGISGKRLRHFQARARDPAWLGSWREALARAARIPFFAGANDRGWRATVDWFLRPDSVLKVLEGAYPSGRGPPPRPPPTAEERAARLQAERERSAREKEQAAKGISIRPKPSEATP